jgi:ribonuclease HI
LTQHTTYDAEAIGITLAAYLLGQEKNIQRATISLDNQVVITSLDICKPKSGQNIIDEFLQQIEKKWKRSNKVTYQLDVTWVKGHSNIEGNKRVDKEAKKAAKSKMNKERKLPSFLSETPLPLSASAIHQEYKQKLKEEWKARWEEWPRHLKLSRIDPLMPSNKDKRLTEGLRRLQASLIMQLRTGHVVLDKYLHRISKSDTPRCPSCHHEEESIHHYIFNCPTWKHERSGKETRTKCQIPILRPQQQERSRGTIEVCRKNRKTQKHTQ